MVLKAGPRKHNQKVWDYLIQLWQKSQVNIIKVIILIIDFL